MTESDKTVKSLMMCPACSIPSPGPYCIRDGAILDGPFEVDGRYLVEELLGGGDVSLVYGAKHMALGKPVALKVLRSELAGDTEQAKRFLREARNASQLAHENIVGITDFGHDEGTQLIYLTMERLSGTTLDRAIKPRMPLDRALRILLQLARAMSAAHAAGVVHRNIQPHNIFLVSSSGRDDQVKLCDFGLSRQADGNDRVTVTGTMLGTPAYMAPEQVRGDAVQDHRVDLYGFGCTAYEVLTGRPAHRADTPGSLLANKLAGSTLVSPSELVPDAGVPPELDELVIRCLSTNPADRPAGAAELEEVIGGLLSSSRKPFAPSSLIGQMIGSHRVTRLVGSGGIGSVYQAEHPLIGTQVAIKVLRSEIANDTTMIERFVLEARSSSSIGSPHIPRYLDFGHLPGGQPYAVMEYLDGETLGSRLRRLGMLSLDEVIGVATQVASAMKAAHALGIIHRDLKPDNIFVARTPEGGEVVKVLDFGIAKLMSPDGGSVQRTQLGLVLGTAYYCAPEQALGLEVGPTADVYALGVTIYEMLTGQPPFQGPVSAILGAKTTQEAPPIRNFRADLTPAVELGIAAMLARDPDSRMGTMSEVLVELAAWTGRDPATVKAVPMPMQTEGHVLAMVPRREPSSQDMPRVATVPPVEPEPARDFGPWKRRAIIAGSALAVALFTIFLVSEEDAPARRPAKKTPAAQQVTPSREASATPAPVREAAKEPVREAAKEPVREAAKEPVREAAKEPVREAAKEPVREAAKAPVREAAKEPVREVAPPVASPSKTVAAPAPERPGAADQEPVKVKKKKREREKARGTGNNGVIFDPFKD